MKILSFYSIKGGVGKTAAAVNIAYLCSLQKMRVLLCDLDLQGSASYYFKIKSDKKFDAADLLHGSKRLFKNVKSTDYDNLHLLPSDVSYRSMDLQLDAMKHSRKRLHEALYLFEDEYDLVVIDCPPTQTLVSENIFTASDYVFIPLVPTPLSVESYKLLRRFLKENEYRRDRFIPFFSMVERRKKLHTEVLTRMREKHPQTLKTEIPYLSEIERMGTLLEPVAHSHPASRASKVYEALCKEILGLYESKQN